MHRLPLLAGLSLALLAAAPAAAQMITLTPAQVGEVFCISRLGNDMAPIEGLLTADLDSAIAEAERLNAEYETAHPGDKPPLGDGIPWQSWQDYAAGCEVGAVTLMMDEAAVAIAYSFPEAPDANFTDSLKLRLIDDPAANAPVWRIDNLSYATEGDLRSVLKNAFLPN